MANIEYRFEPNRLTNPSGRDVSYFGTPVRDAVEFLAGSYITAKGVNQFEGLIIQDATIDAARVKNIVTTQTVGDAGEFVEFIGNGNYDITINVNVNEAQGVFPFADFSKLIDIVNAPAVIEVSCDFLNQLGIYAIVITRHNLTNSAGFVNQQRITIEAKEYINLNLKRK